MRGWPCGAERSPRAMRPTVVLGVTDDMTIAHDEIFGPILPVFTYRTIAEAITFVDARPRPLALCYYGHDKAGSGKCSTAPRRATSRSMARSCTSRRTICVRRRRGKRYGRIPWNRRLPRAQPRQGHIRAGPLEQHRLPACSLRGPCRYSSQGLSPVIAAPNPAPVDAAIPSILDTWVTVHSEVLGNTLGPNGFILCT